jgi:hypothetical protein
MAAELHELYSVKAHEQTRSVHEGQAAPAEIPGNLEGF